jgi:hypothetical protein
LFDLFSTSTDFLRYHSFFHNLRYDRAVRLSKGEDPWYEEDKVPSNWVEGDKEWVAVE